MSNILDVTATILSVALATILATLLFINDRTLLMVQNHIHLKWALQEDFKNVILLPSAGDYM